MQYTEITTKDSSERITEVTLVWAWRIERYSFPCIVLKSCLNCISIQESQASETSDLALQ